MINLAIFASGSGTNAEAICRHFEHHPTIKVRLILSNKKEAGVLERASRLGIPSALFSKSELEEESFLDVLKKSNIDLIILAGFLLKVPAYLVKAFPARILNIHPALLPKYGGKGMYGHHVHKAVIANGEKKSGITIHLVDEIYDNGETLFQAELDVLQDDSADSLASRIHVLEHEHFPRVIEKYATSLT